MWKILEVFSLTAPPPRLISFQACRDMDRGATLAWVGWWGQMVAFPLTAFSEFCLWTFICAGHPLSPSELLCNLFICSQFKCCFFLCLGEWKAWSPGLCPVTVAHVSFSEEAEVSAMLLLWRQALSRCMAEVALHLSFSLPLNVKSEALKLLEGNRKNTSTQ